jgi:hypothetical protein
LHSACEEARENGGEDANPVIKDSNEEWQMVNEEP